LAARALWVCALLALIAASVLGVALPADEAAAQALGGRNFRLISQGGGQIQLSWSTGTGQTGYRLNRITTTGTVVVAPSLASTATSFTDTLGTSVNVACYQLEILNGTAVVGTSDILCVIVNVASGLLPPRNASIQTNESPIVTIRWDLPTGGGQTAFLVVPLGRPPLALLPATATQAVDAPGEPTCYIILTLIPDSALVPFRIGGFSDIVCAIPGVFSPQPNTPTITRTATTTSTVPTATVPTGTSLPTSTGTQTIIPTGTSTFTPANVVVSKIDNPDPVQAGQDTTYTVTVTNLGQTATGPVFVEDNLPAGLTYLVASANQGFVCNEVQGTVSCSGPNLTGGQSVTISILVRADNPCVVNSPVTNTVRAQIGGPPGPLSPTSSQQTTILGCTQVTQTVTATATRTVTSTTTSTALPPTVTLTPAVDLVINKIDTPDPVVPPGSLQYTLVVQNNGNVAANNISVRDTLDPAIFNGDFSFGSAAGDAGFVCSFDTNQIVSCTGGNLGPNGGATISIVLNYNFCGQTYYVNTAVVDPANTVTEFNENNNSVVSQTACGAGVSTATPIGTSTSTVTPTRTATGIATIVPTTSLGFLKLDAPDPVVNGGSITYTLRLTNTSSSSISGVTLQDNLPAEVTFQQVTSASGGFICTFLGAPSPNGTVQCSNGTLAANSVTDIVIVVAVTGNPCISPIVNTATIITPAVANNSATSSTVVSGCNTTTPTSTSSPTQTLTPTVTTTTTPTSFDLGVTKTAAASVNSGGALSYTITVNATGTGTVNGITLFDQLPAGFTFGSFGVSTWPTVGTNCTVNGSNQLNCVNGSVTAPGSLTVVVNGTATGCTALANVATITAPADSNPANNTSTPAVTNVVCADLDVTFTDNSTVFGPDNSASGNWNSTALYLLANNSATAITGITFNVTESNDATAGTSSTGNFVAAPVASLASPWTCASNGFNGNVQAFWVCTGSLLPGESVPLDFAMNGVPGATASSTVTWDNSVTCTSPGPCTSGVISPANSDGSILDLNATNTPATSDPITLTTDLDIAAFVDAPAGEDLTAAGGYLAAAQYQLFNDRASPMTGVTFTGTLGGTALRNTVTAQVDGGAGGTNAPTAWVCTVSLVNTWSCTGDLTADTQAGSGSNTPNGADPGNFVTITIQVAGTGVATETVTFTPNAPTCTNPGPCTSGFVSPANADGGTTIYAPDTDTLT